METVDFSPDFSKESNAVTRFLIGGLIMASCSRGPTTKNIAVQLENLLIVLNAQKTSDTFGSIFSALLQSEFRFGDILEIPDIEGGEIVPYLNRRSQYITTARTTTNTYS